MRFVSTGGRIDAIPVVDRVNVHDPSVVEGSPIFAFRVKESGTVHLWLANLPGDAAPEYALTIAPDYSTRNWIVLGTTGVLYATLVAGGIGYLYYRRNRERLEQESASRQAKRDRFEEWMSRKR